MRSCSDYQIQQMAEKQCETAMQRIKGYIATQNSLELNQTSMEEWILREVNRDRYIYTFVLAPDGKYTIDDIDSLLFSMCSIFKEKYGANISYQQMIRISQFEIYLDQEDFGYLPDALIDNGWRHKDYSVDILIHVFSSRTNYIPTYSKMEILVERMKDYAYS